MTRIDTIGDLARDLRGQVARVRYGKVPEIGDFHREVRLEEEGNRVVKEILGGSGPVLVARLGGYEASTCSFRMRWRSHGPIRAPWPHGVRRRMRQNAGFFPVDAASLDRFVDVYLDALTEVDVLGAFLFTPNEHILARDFCPAAQLIQLESLNSMSYEDPWSAALEAKRVLVVHPFAESIERQYARRELLFANPGVLPQFELQTLKAVQSIAGNEVPFASWFEALDSMTEEIGRREFDVALIGAGAYGLPLGARVKRMGRTAVHMGGATQLLFGIIGNRWEVAYGGRYRSLVNEAWIRPSDSERPEGAHRIENGCYW